MRLAKLGASALEWRQLDWLPRYEISEVGDLRRVGRFHGYADGSLLSGHLNPAGYRVYHLYADGRRKRFLAHRLVCEAWHGPSPAGKTNACHCDGNQANNHHSNLRWDDDAGNMADRMAHGNYVSGEKHHRSKLSDELVAELRARRPAWNEVKQIAEERGVSPQTVWNAATGRTYRQLEAA